MLGCGLGGGGRRWGSRDLELKGLRDWRRGGGLRLVRHHYDSLEVLQNCMNGDGSTDREL